MTRYLVICNSTDRNPLETPMLRHAGTSTPGPRGRGVRTFPNGLKIENIAMGAPDAKLAKAGKRVKMRWAGCAPSHLTSYPSTLPPHCGALSDLCPVLLPRMLFQLLDLKPVLQVLREIDVWQDL